jgi:biopolymer transport protein TolR
LCRRSCREPNSHENPGTPPADARNQRRAVHRRDARAAGDLHGHRELPSVSKASNAPVAPLEVVIRADQTVLLRVRDAKGALLDERRVPRGQLAKLVHERQAKAPDTPVLIAADKSVRYEAVLNVMDELRREQIRRVGLLVKPAL